MDTAVLGFTAALAVLTALAFGWVPALWLTRGDQLGSLREAGRRGGTRGTGYRRVLGTLVVTEVALSLVLLTGAGLLLRSLWRLQEVPSGFDPTGLVTFQMGANAARYPGIAQQAELYRKVAERVAAMPGVDAVAAVHRLPLYRFPTTTGFTIEGRPVPAGARTPTADVRIITPGYFRAMHIPLLEGRELSERDDAAATQVIVISKSLAEKHWPGESPLGKRVQIGANLTDWWEIVGVVGDVRLRGLDVESGPAMYWTLQQNFFPTALRSVSLLVRGKADPASVAAAVRRAVREVDPEEGLASAQTMEDVLQQSYAQRSLNLALMLVFAGIASVLAAVGLYGMMSYSVTQRTQEIGIRMALGADAGSVMRMIIRHGALLALLGVAVGLAGTLALSRLLSSLLFRVSPTDPATLAGMAALLVGVALLAAYLPARRAAGTDPLIALRHE